MAAEYMVKTEMRITFAVEATRNTHYDAIKAALDAAVAAASSYTGELEKWDEDEVATPVVTLSNEVSVEY